VLDAWTVPLTEASLRGFLRNPDGEIRLIAELDGEPVGLGALVVRNSELRACYVVPEASRKGVGTALVAEIERIAAEKGLERLELLASLNAEPFYARLGYEAHGRTEHVLRTGQRMAAVKMVKMLRR
jgi:putative acetyltransferase